MREAAIESYLNAKAQELGWLTYKFTSPGTRGVPDRILIQPGGAVHFVEVKRDNGVISQSQQYQASRMRRIGASVHVVWSRAGVDEFFASFAD